VGHLEWLEPLLEAHRQYRQGLQRVRAIHARVEELLERLRHEHLYDYESSAAEYLVSVSWEGEDVEE
jgi:type II secretory pathway component PulM